jgi:YVTN family beta-propeller protein
LSKIFLISIFVGIILAGGYSILFDYAYSETPSYTVINPDFEGKATSAIVDEKTNKVYITDFFGGKLVVLDGKSNKVLESIDVVRTPFGVGINSETNMIYVGGEYANTLSIFNGTTSQVIKNISLKDPYDIAVNPSNNKVYVTSDRLDLVYVIDGDTNEIETSFEVLIPCGITVNPITGMVYVTSESENIVHVWDGNTNQQITTIKVQESPRGITVNPLTNMIYVTNQKNNTVSVIDGVQNKVIKTIPVKEPFELAINSETGKLYSMYYGGELSIITKEDKQKSPLKQFFSGMDPHEIKCKNGLSLIFKNSNFNPACVKPSSIQKLIDWGWAMDHAPEHTFEAKN